MTRIEAFTKAIAEVESVELKEFFENEIEKIKASNERKKSKTSESRRIENEPIKHKIIEFLKGKDWTLASDIAKGCDISTQKVTALLKQIEGIESTDIKVAKVGTRKAYKLS